MLIRTHPTRGFTLIEVMITIAVVGILAALGLPSFFAWIQNQKIRTASEAVINGVQLARAEAISRNLSGGVRFTLVPATGDWTVDTVPASAKPLHVRPGGEATSNARFTVTPSDATIVTFGPLGSVIPNADASSSIARIDIDNPMVTAADGARPLRILVGASGNVLMCDPGLTVTNPGDPRACP
jgi:type IV fimbrial biogenesis protein FimT